MKITSVIQKEFVIEELRAATKEEVLAELASVLPRDSIKYTLEDVVKILMERERLGSTGIGDGIAIPHGKIPGLGDLHVSFGRSKKGVAFDALDGKPVYLFFLLMAPEHASGQYLKALAKISRMLKDNTFKTSLMEAKSREDLHRVIAAKDEEGSING